MTDDLVAALAAPDWRTVLDGVTAATTWLASVTPGDGNVDTVVEKLVALASHPKWEVRRGVAAAASKTLHTGFEPVLARLAADHNARVSQAAEAAALRRRDWGSASAFGREHEDRINATLDDIEARFGARGRVAVKRAAEHIAHTFARELYHEVARLLSPLATSADRLVLRVGDENERRTVLVEEATKMKHRVNRLRSVLEAMRAYAAPPSLTFASENLREVIEESVAIARDAHRSGPEIRVSAAAELPAVVCRSRLVQALTNVLANAMEAYDGLVDRSPIEVTAIAEEQRVLITVEDHGCGMSAERLADATVLFATSKENGTGFGLPLAVKIVESEHGGSLTLDSQKGTGTKVRVIVLKQRPGERP
jgi:nitrogen fixation/metabolism regulation signal transduction histidine kinase